MNFCLSVLFQGVVARHSNVHVDMTTSSPSNDSEEQPSAGQDMETGSYELQESDEPNDNDKYGPVVVDLQAGLGIVKGAAKRGILSVTSGESEEDDETLEFFETPPIKQEFGSNKRDASGSLMGRKFDCSATSYNQTLTLSTENNKVS
jgi:hypothetical protein